MLASIFKDVYTKDIIRRDTLSNLVKSKRGQSSSHHERYVEELQQVHLALGRSHARALCHSLALCVPLPQVHHDYSECIKQADELERHLIKARARAAATEREAYGKIREEIGDLQDHQGLFTGEWYSKNVKILCISRFIVSPPHSPVGLLPVCGQ